VTAALVFEEVWPYRGPQSWRQPLSLEVEARSHAAIVTDLNLATALFRLTLGLPSSASGSVRVLGTNPHALRRRELRALRRRVGSCLLPDGLMANVTLRANIVLPLLFGDGYSMQDAQARADEVLERFRLSAWADRRPAALPPATRQVAALARAVAGRPELLLLHDPLTLVPSSEALRLLAICRELTPTVVVALHDDDEVFCRTADLVIRWGDSGYHVSERG
jgi:ABC-type methionine transport system ATPase subunit